jgi:hypothetical protein
MFTYLSLLVDEFYFDKIEVGFLVVGHTHSSIDQYFSVISKAIKKSSFIGSPLALLKLIERAHSEPNNYGNSKTIIRNISVYYDIKNMLDPYINRDIKYFGVPHRFKFERAYNVKCYMQYSLFSNMKYLPIVPHNSSKDNLFQNDTMVDEIHIPEDILEVVGGHQVNRKIYENCGGDSANFINEQSGNVDMERIKNRVVVDKMLPFLKNFCKESIIVTENRLEDESHGKIINREEDLARYRENLVIEANKLNNNKEGYIFWTKPRAGLAPFNSSIIPKPIFPEDYMDELISKSRGNDNITMDVVENNLNNNIIATDDNLDSDNENKLPSSGNEELDSDIIEIFHNPNIDIVDDEDKIIQSEVVIIEEEYSGDTSSKSRFEPSTTSTIPNPRKQRKEKSEVYSRESLKSIAARMACVCDHILKGTIKFK